MCICSTQLIVTEFSENPLFLLREIVINFWMNMIYVCEVKQLGQQSRCPNSYIRTRYILMGCSSGKLVLNYHRSHLKSNSYFLVIYYYYFILKLRPVSIIVYHIWRIYDTCAIRCTAILILLIFRILQFNLWFKCLRFSILNLLYYTAQS